MKPSSTLLVFLFLLSACATSPTGQRQLKLISDEQMAEMGTQSFDEMKRKIPQSTDAHAKAYVQCIVQSLNPVIDAGHRPANWEIVIFNSKEANAFALPGGKIGVYTKMLEVASTPSMLATVLGHEIGHVLADHSNARVSEQLVEQGLLKVGGVLLGENANRDLILGGAALLTQYTIALPHSRAQETEADMIGLDLMARAGFNPTDAPELWRRMERESGGGPPVFLSTHPSSASRIEYLQAGVPEAERKRAASGRHPGCK